MSERFSFRVPIGDWSGDGHGKADWYDVTAAKPVEAAREAYFAAKEKIPALCPETFCNEYEVSEIPDSIAGALAAAGCPMPDDPDAFGTEDMAAIVVWFMNQGDPDLDARAASRPPMLPFYGFDAKQRHIGFIGYGLLGS